MFQFLHLLHYFFLSVGITSSVVGIKIFAITAGIKKYKSIIKKEEKAWENRIVRKIELLWIVKRILSNEKRNKIFWHICTKYAI